MTDLAYVLATVVLFAAIAVVARRFGERGTLPVNAPVNAPANSLAASPVDSDVPAADGRPS